MRSSFDQHNECDPLNLNTNPYMDRRIGDAYDVVTYVAKNMDALLALTPAASRVRYVTGTAGARGQTVEVPLPVDIDPYKVQGFTVALKDTDGDIWLLDSGYFKASLQAGALQFYLDPQALAACVGGLIQWNILTTGL